jgi:hypothetical protein
MGDVAPVRLSVDDNNNDNDNDNDNDDDDDDVESPFISTADTVYESASATSVNETVTCALPATTPTRTGGDGTVEGRTDALLGDGAPANKN